MARVRVAFADFWDGFEPSDVAFPRFSSDQHEFELADRDQADLLIYSKFGQTHRSFPRTKLFLTIENLRPRWREADFCIGFDLLNDPRYLRLPYYALLAMMDAASPDDIRAPAPWGDREFCAFVYSHPGPPQRRALFDVVSKCGPVTSPGKFLHNADAPELEPRFGDWRRSKLEYLRRFRFVIACENSSHPGYTTEKLYDALLAGAIPIYWGNPRVAEDFDARAYVDCRQLADLADVSEVVRQIDGDPERAQSYLSAAPGMLVPVDEWERSLHAFLDTVAGVALSGRGRWLRRARAFYLPLHLTAGRARARARHRRGRAAARLRPRR